MSIKAKDRMRKHAIRILRNMKPLPAWEASLSDEWKNAICRQFGSAEALYNRLRDELLKEAMDPSPNVVTVGNDGKAVFGWE